MHEATNEQQDERQKERSAKEKALAEKMLKEKETKKKGLLGRIADKFKRTKKQGKK